MQTTEITIDVTGSTMKAHCARPDGDAPAPAVIVIQEIFGISDAMRAVAGLLANAGYVAIVPAFYHRIDPDFSAGHDEAGRERGIAARNQTSIPHMRADLEATVAWLRTQPFVAPAIATWGFCWGGSVAYLSATIDGIDAAVAFYGGQIGKSPVPGNPPMLDFTSQIHAPLFLSFGGRDESIPAEEIEKIRTTLDAQHKTYELEVYPNEGHGYFRDGIEKSAGAADVWPKVQAFLQRCLNVPAAR